MKPNSSRRAFLVASAAGVAGYRFGGPSLAGAATATNEPLPISRTGAAKSTILFFLCGGASHMDTWDMKPNAPSEYRGPFRPIKTSAPEIQLCEHLPMTAKVAKHIAIVRSVGDSGRTTGDHHAGYYYNLTGHAPDQTFRLEGNDRRPYPDDWPFMGSVVAMRRGQHPSLPTAITLPHKPSRLPYIRPGQFAGKLGMDFDPFYLNGDLENPLRFQAPSLTLTDEVGKPRLDDREALLHALDNARRELDHNLTVQGLTSQQARAFSLLSSATSTSAFDVSSEPDSLRERYGSSVNAMSLLMARRLVEAEVPFITVFWKEDKNRLASKCRSAGGWDTHGNNFGCLQNDLLPQFDQAYSALIEDLARTNLLDQTLVMVSSEMGRKPKIGDPRSGGVVGAGRDHWTSCQSILLAGGGIRGGQTFGASDKYGEYPDEKPLSPSDITKTVYHAMGVDNLMAFDREQRPFNIVEEGRVLSELF